MPSSELLLPFHTFYCFLFPWEITMFDMEFQATLQVFLKEFKTVNCQLQTIRRVMVCTLHVEVKMKFP